MFIIEKLVFIQHLTHRALGTYNLLEISFSNQKIFGRLTLKIPTFFSRFRYSMETVCKLFKKVSKNLLLCINI